MSCSPSITDFEGGPSRDENTTEDMSPAFERAKQLFIENRTIDGGPILTVPPGFYYLKDTFEMNEVGFGLIGPGGGMTGGNGAVLIFGPDAKGIIVGRHNTAGDEVVPTHAIGGDGSRIEGLRLRPKVGRSGAPVDGITLYARATVKGCFLEGWRDGIHTVAPPGNSNGVHVETCRIEGSTRDGLHTIGSDTNAGVFIGIDTAFCGRWGVYDEAIFGNLYLGGQSEANGWVRNGVTTRHSRVFHNGFIWLLMVRRDFDGGSVEPGTDNEEVWERMIPAPGPDPDEAPQWERGETYVAGGAYAAVNPLGLALFLNPYSESGQPPSQILAPSLAFGGKHGAGYSRRSNVFDSGTWTQGFAIGNDPAGLAMELGRAGAFLALWHYARLPHINRLQVDLLNNDLIWNIGNQTVPTFRITQPGTSYKFGRSAPVPNAFLPSKLFLSPNPTGQDDGRQIDIGYGPPVAAEGERAHGDFRFNFAPSPGADLGWSCIEGGTPGVWVSAGKIAAQ